MGPGSRASVGTGTFHSQLSETVSSWFDVLTNCGPCDRIERHHQGHKSSSRRSRWAEKLPEVAGVGAHWPGNPSECKTWPLPDTATSTSPRVLVSPIRGPGVYGYVGQSASRSNYLAFGPSASRSDYLAFGDQDLAPADAKPATGFGAPFGASSGSPFVSTISPSTLGSSADLIGLKSDFDVILATDAVERKVGHSPTPGPTVASNAPLHSRMTTQDETADRRKVDNSRLDAAPENSPQTTPQTTPQMNPSATPKTLQPIREHSTSERRSGSPTGEQIATRLALAPPSKGKFSPRSEALAGEPGYADVAISPGRPAQAGESELRRIFQERQQRAGRKRDSFLACEKEREERERAKVEEEREHERTREREQRERREQEQARDRAQRERELRQAVAMRAATPVSPRHHEEQGVQAETEEGGRKGGRETEFTTEGTDENWEHSSDSEEEENELGAC
jgi:hypothetical protein